MASVDLHHQVQVCLAALEDAARHSPHTLTKVTETAEQLVGYLTACQVNDIRRFTGAMAERFVNAPGVTGHQPSVPTRHLRRTNLRILFRAARQEGFVDNDPTVDLILPARSLTPARPLTDEEIALGRLNAFHDNRVTRQPVAWAIAEAGATTSEIAHITGTDLDLDSCTVRLPGTRNIRPRTGTLTSWGVATIGAWRTVTASSDGPVVYAGSADTASPQASVSQMIHKVMERAGLSREPDIRPSSIPAWAARSIFDQTGDITAAARVLGVRSLDTAARRIGWNWTVLEPGSQP